MHYYVDAGNRKAKRLLFRQRNRSAAVDGKVNKYDDKYRLANYFRYRRWLYRPFVKALIKKADLTAGCRVLDVGCGQGFFSSLFSDLGLKPVGVDVSAEAIHSAKRDYSFSGASFEIGDALSLGCKDPYDCVFARGLSLYNLKDLEGARDVTDVLLRYLNPGGVLIFDYYTNLNGRKKSESWIYHSLMDATRHFSSYPGAEVYFSLRIEMLVFGSWALSFPFTVLSAFISRSLGIGGELIAFVPHHHPRRYPHLRRHPIREQLRKLLDRFWSNQY